jgi:hypothetical protein
LHAARTAPKQPRKTEKGRPTRFWKAETKLLTKPQAQAQNILNIANKQLTDCLSSAKIPALQSKGAMQGVPVLCFTIFAGGFSE